MKLVTIYDKQAGFNPPMVHINEGTAIRWFGEQCLKEDTPMHKHPEDFELMIAGDFDEQKGITNVVTPYKIASAEQYVAANK